VISIKRAFKWKPVAYAPHSMKDKNAGTEHTEIEKRGSRHNLGVREVLQGIIIITHISYVVAG